jgi:hypothetical protein
MELGDQVSVQGIHKVRKRKKGKVGESKKDSYGVSTYRPEYLGKPETLKKGQTTVSANLNREHKSNHQHCKQHIHLVHGWYYQQPAVFWILQTTATSTL